MQSFAGDGQIIASTALFMRETRQWQCRNGISKSRVVIKGSNLSLGQFLCKIHGLCVISYPQNVSSWSNFEYLKKLCSKPHNSRSMHVEPSLVNKENYTPIYIDLNAYIIVNENK